MVSVSLGSGKGEICGRAWGGVVVPSLCIQESRVVEWDVALARRLVAFESIAVE